jgi:hypothetical protein
MRSFHLTTLVLLLVLGASDNLSAGPRLGLSFDQITQYLSNYITLDKSTPVAGQPRYMGMTDDKLAALEIIGDRNNITQASLMIGLPNDSNAALVRNSALFMRFVKNATPGWIQREDWAIAALKRATASESPVSTVFGSRLITVSFLKPLGMVIVTVKHR